MAAVNNLKGHPVKDGNIIHFEKIADRLYLAIVLMYEPIGTPNSTWRNSSQLSIQVTITTGEKHQFSNGIVSLTEAKIHQEVKFEDEYEKLPENIYYSEKGYKIWLEIHGDGTRLVFDKSTNKEIKYKFRQATWICEIPKKDLLEFYKTNSGLN